MNHPTLLEDLRQILRESRTCTLSFDAQLGLARWTKSRHSLLAEAQHKRESRGKKPHIFPPSLPLPLFIYWVPMTWQALLWSPQIQHWNRKMLSLLWFAETSMSQNVSRGTFFPWGISHNVQKMLLLEIHNVQFHSQCPKKSYIKKPVILGYSASPKCV